MLFCENREDLSADDSDFANGTRDSPSSRSRIQSRSTLGSRGTSLSLSRNFSSGQHIAFLELYIPGVVQIRVFFFLERRREGGKRGYYECEWHITTRMHSPQRARTTARKLSGKRERERKEPRRKIEENDETRREL